MKLSVLQTILLICLVVFFGLLSVNQYYKFRYKMIFLQTPCDVCVDLNPQLESCFEDTTIYYINKNTGEKINKSEYEKRQFDAYPKINVSEALKNLS